MRGQMHPGRLAASASAPAVHTEVSVGAMLRGCHDQLVRSSHMGCCANCLDAVCVSSRVWRALDRS